MFQKSRTRSDVRSRVHRLFSGPFASPLSKGAEARPSPASANGNTLSLIVIHRARPGRRRVARAHMAGAPGVRAGRWRVLRERLPELRAETLLVFLFASKACEEGVSRRALDEKKKTEGTGPYLYCRRTRP